MSLTDAKVGAFARFADSKADELPADEALVKRVQNGDVEAFDQLVAQHRQRLYAILYNLTGNREDASDLAQETFIKAFRSIHRFKGKSSFFTWLYRIGVNTTLSHLKKGRKRQFFSFEAMRENGEHTEDLMDELASRRNGQREALIAELQEKLNEALQKLSLKHRTVIVLFEIEQLSHAEIAKITGTSEGTVRSRLHYAKQLLQSDLADYL